MILPFLLRFLAPRVVDIIASLDNQFNQVDLVQDSDRQMPTRSLVSTTHLPLIRDHILFSYARWVNYTASDPSVTSFNHSCVWFLLGSSFHLWIASSPPIFRALVYLTIQGVFLAFITASSPYCSWSSGVLTHVAVWRIPSSGRLQTSDGTSVTRSPGFGVVHRVAGLHSIDVPEPSVMTGLVFSWKRSVSCLLDASANISHLTSVSSHLGNFLHSSGAQPLLFVRTGR